jgi:hypothetical protein
LNPRQLLQNVVLKILKCRKFRGNGSEREGADFSLWCRINTSLRSRQTLESSAKKSAQHKTIGMFGVSSQQRSQAVLEEAYRYGEQVFRLQQ